MMEMMRKLMMISIGAVSLTKEKAEQLVKELSEKGQISTSEAKAFVKELLEKGEKERQQIQKTIASEFGKLREEWGLVTKKDLAEVNARLARIEERLFGKVQAPEESPAADSPAEGGHGVQS
ncbi:phasin family protein [Desulforudis sp. 1088]|uniref:phasin family protein n=1 Tax=unclassified Candidatus Desulforudis TaxID=2635950 RepID=UPI003CE50EB1